MIKLATTTEQPQMTKSAQIRKFVAEHPFTKATTIAKKMGMDRQYVYTVMWNMKNKNKLAKKKKAMTNKELVDLRPALEFLEGRAQARKEEEQWESSGLYSSDTSFYGDTPSPHTQRIVELTGEIADNIKRNQELQIKMFEPKADAVNHPAHYKVGGIETIDFIEAKKLNYNIGNVVKYLTRADHKGNRKQDLEKAKWYLERELSTMS